MQNFYAQLLAGFICLKSVGLWQIALKSSSLLSLVFQNQLVSFNEMLFESDFYHFQNDFIIFEVKWTKGARNKYCAE